MRTGVWLQAAEDVEETEALLMKQAAEGTGPRCPGACPVFRACDRFADPPAE
jgi:hypothetical protein